MRALMLIAVLLFSSPALSDTPPSAIYSVDGDIGALLTGVSLAADTDTNARVNVLSLPASFTVTTSMVPVTASLDRAFLYWGGNQTQTGGPLSGTPDTTVTLGVPSGAFLSVVADTCHGSDAGSSTYDIFLCRADITADLLTSATSLSGSYSVDHYTGPIADGSADNASAALILIYQDSSLSSSRVILYDGLMTLSNSSQLFTLGGLSVDPQLSGELTYYVLEGDTAGSGTEFVTVTGQPGSVALPLSDAVNPVGNPMNSTINTAVPVVTGSIGIDIDRFDVGGALTENDDSLDVEYGSGTDKYWLGPQLLVTSAPLPVSVPTMPVIGLLGLFIALVMVRMLR